MQYLTDIQDSDCVKCWMAKEVLAKLVYPQVYGVNEKCNDYYQINEDIGYILVLLNLQPQSCFPTMKFKDNFCKQLNYCNTCESP